MSEREIRRRILDEPEDQRSLKERTWLEQHPVVFTFYIQETIGFTVAHTGAFARADFC